MPTLHLLIASPMLGDACLCDLRNNVLPLAGKNNKNIFTQTLTNSG